MFVVVISIVTDAIVKFYLLSIAILILKAIIMLVRFFVLELTT